jgi:hypothetical protein
MLLQKKFITHLLKKHPTLSTAVSAEKLEELISPQLLSPFQLELPASLLIEAKDFVRATFQLRESSQYQKLLSPQVQERGLKDPGNKSILMSYDFHVDSENHLKLIEINTNASFLALGCEMYEMRQLPLPVQEFSFSDLQLCIETEMKLQGKSIPEDFKIAIIDEEPERQRLFIEFLVYQSHFKKWGWNSEILDYRKVSDVDFVYNRLTDFFLAQPESQNLRKQFLNKAACFSPNPYEYLMLADKHRMIDWCSDEFWSHLSSAAHLRPTIQKNLPVAKELEPALAQEIWSERKKFFFKPKRAFGAKHSFRGESISRRAFDEILNQDFIAQEFIPAPERNFQTPDGEQKFKFDLRFYVYQDQVQMVVARLYQGQVTNLRTLYGGFAPVLFT